ncbi:MAG: apolipoprotein N-acyltransferase [Myxococcota bacterium]
MTARSAGLALLATAGTGLLYGLYARIEAPFFVLGFFGLVPAILWIDGADSLASALRRGWLVCVGFTVGVFGWFASAVSTYTGLPPSCTWPLLALGAPLLQPQWIAYAGLRQLAAARARRTGRGTRWAALVGIGAYLACEWEWPKLLGDSLGHGLWPDPRLRQAADLAGVAGLSLALLASNEALARAARAVQRGRRRPALAAALLATVPVLSLLVYGEWRLASLPRAKREIRVGVVQAGLSDYAELRRRLGSFAAARRILDEHFSLSRTALSQGAQLLVWPETVYPTTFGSPRSQAGRELDDEIRRFVRGAGAPLIFGSYDAGEHAEYNAAVYLEPEDLAAGRGGGQAYRKAALFPLTERVPDWLDGERARSWLPWLGTWSESDQGGRVVRLTSGRDTLVTAPLICYDAVAPAYARRAVRAGAELLVVLSNDAWFDGGRGSRLHLAVSGFRTIETRRPQVRATPTGVSIVLDARGEALAEAGNGERAVLIANLPLGPGPRTLVLAWGDWLGPALGALAALAGVWLWRAPPRQAARRSTRPARRP